MAVVLGLLLPGADPQELQLGEPVRAALFWLAVVAAVGAGTVAWFGFGRGPDWRPFAAVVTMTAAGLLGLAVVTAPVVVPPGLTVHQAASPHSPQLFLVLGVGLCMPFVLAYQVYAWRSFRGKYTDRVEPALPDDAPDRLALLAGEEQPLGRYGPAARSVKAIALPLLGSSATLTTTLQGPGLVLVTGPNGSGKSILLGRLAGRLPAPAGTVLLDGIPVQELPARAVAETVTLVEADDWLADDTVAANLRQPAPSADPAALHGPYWAWSASRPCRSTPRWAPAGDCCPRGSAGASPPRYLLDRAPTAVVRLGHTTDGSPWARSTHGLSRNAGRTVAVRVR